MELWLCHITLTLLFMPACYGMIFSDDWRKLSLSRPSEGDRRSGG